MKKKKKKRTGKREKEDAELGSENAVQSFLPSSKPVKFRKIVAHHECNRWIQRFKWLVNS